MTPLARACRALRLPPALYCDRGDLPRPDAEICCALCQQHVAAKRLVFALADVLAEADLGAADPDAFIDDVWQLAAAVAKARDLPPSLIGALAVLAMLPEEGAIDADELGLWVEAAP